MARTLEKEEIAQPWMRRSAVLVATSFLHMTKEYWRCWENAVVTTPFSMELTTATCIQAEKYRCRWLRSDRMMRRSISFCKILRPATKLLQWK